MSSPSRTFLRRRGWRMMTGSLSWLSIFVATRRTCRVGSDFASAISSRTSLRAQSLRGHMGRSFLPVIVDKPQLWSITGPLYVGRQPKSIVAPACIRQYSVCCRRCSIVPSHIIEHCCPITWKKCPFCGANISWLFFALLSFIPFGLFLLSAQDSVARSYP